MNSSPVRVRMAPSPTGYFHVGSARTALFNYLFARHCGGTFVLRIEDTDLARNDPEYERVIYEAMSWLGLEADESPQKGGDFGPYRQSERFPFYRELAAKLEAQGLAYRAFETAEELAQMREEQRQHKQPPRYNGAHRDLSPEQIAAFEAQGRKSVLRLRVPGGETTFQDAVYGPVKWKNGEIDDFVLMKGDATPAYNFACVADDHAMQISHVLRGEDGLSNTPRQILIYGALGLTPPIFAHIPFILGPDRKKLSKRHTTGEKAAEIPVRLMDYAEMGLFPDALFNYLAFLGWNPGSGETQEFFTRDELVARFSLEGVNKAGAIFDLDKLNWMNIQYLKNLPFDEFLSLARPYLNDLPLDEALDYTRRALELARDRIQSLPDIRRGALPFFSDDFPTDEAGAAKHLSPEAFERIALLREKLANLPAWTHDAIEVAIRALAESLGIKPAALIHPSRLLVSGQTVGPSLFELLEALGRERVVRRLGKTTLDSA